MVRRQGANVTCEDRTTGGDAQGGLYGVRGDEVRDVRGCHGSRTEQSGGGSRAGFADGEARGVSVLGDVKGGVLGGR